MIVAITKQFFFLFVVPPMEGSSNAKDPVDLMIEREKRRLLEHIELEEKRNKKSKKQVVVLHDADTFELDEEHKTADVLVMQEDGGMILQENVSRGDFALKFALQKQLMGHQLDAIHKFIHSIHMHLEAKATGERPPKGLIIAHSMGAGKTTLALAIVQCVHKHLKAIAVMSPTLENTWMQEYLKWSEHFDFDINFFNDNQSVFYKWKKKGGLLIVREHAFRQNQLDPEGLRFEPDILFYDEAHHAKNYMSKNHEAIRALPDQCYNVLLTGTPYHNDMEEFYHMLKLLGYHWEHKQFVEYYLNRINTGIAPNATHRQSALSKFLLKQLHDEWKPFMHRVDKEVIEGYLKQQGVQLREINIEYTMHDKDLQHLQGHSIFDQQWSILPFTNSAKQRIVLSLLAELQSRGKYTVVVSKSKNVLNELAAIWPGPVLHADAAKNTTTRTKIVTDFQEKKHGKTNDFKNVLYLIYQFGEGISLTSAEYMIICEPNWNPQNREQITRRIYRRGQTQPCTIYHLFAGNTVEMYMVAAAQSKEITCAGILDEKHLTSFVQNQSRLNQLLQQHNTTREVDESVLRAVLDACEFPQITLKCSEHQLCEDRLHLSESDLHACNVANLFFAYEASNNNEEFYRSDVPGCILISQQFMDDGTPYPPLAPYYRKRDEKHMYFLSPAPTMLHQSKFLCVQIKGETTIELENVQLTTDSLVPVPLHHFALDCVYTVHFQFRSADKQSAWSDGSVIRV